tara:strand:+ start:3592 stop:3765 length:174 start_codon:yes stop_codon:yes gene_type:complete
MSERVRTVKDIKEFIEKLDDDMRLTDKIELSVMNIGHFGIMSQRQELHIDINYGENY